MNGTRLLVLFLLALFVVDGAFAAVVGGKLYDEKYNQLTNVLVEITTFPKQSYVSKDGSYSFTLTDGRYGLTAYYRQSNGTTIYTSKEVIASGGGTYTVDLILNEIYTGVPPEITLPFTLRLWRFIKSNIIFIIVGFFSLVLLLTILILLFRRFRRTPKTSPSPPAIPEDLSNLLDLINKGGGRVTQKELRKKLPDVSEAKISLMVSELESNGNVTKIKKGRGNIIVLKKREG